MNNINNQYTTDAAMLAGLIKQFTGISKERLYSFLKENPAAELLPCANIVCETDEQREKLAALFDFKNIYETIKGAELNRWYNIKGTDDAMDFFIERYADISDKERFSVAFLDTGNRIISVKEMFTGTLNESPVYTREIIKEALFKNAASVILAHNHPGGSVKPSQSDIEASERVKAGVEAVGIRLLDHIIVAGDKAYSLTESKHIMPTSSLSISAVAAARSQAKEAPYNKPSVRQQLKALKTMNKGNHTTLPAQSPKAINQPQRR